MTELEQKKIFSRNLNRLIEKSDKKQIDIASDLNVSPQALNTWVKGIAIPRMNRIQALADYFGVSKSDLVDDKPVEEYYIDPQTARIAQEIKDLAIKQGMHTLRQEGIDKVLEGSTSIEEVLRVLV